ncbi:MAG: hypothetical protein K1X91_00375 [Bacteriodetes bacterium]|nr:hypothetical protein [Bacteroidota bacterium]
MKYIFILLVICSLQLYAQVDIQFDTQIVECQKDFSVDLKFDKRAFESEDKWVIIDINEDTSYVFGFIYIDEYAGLSFNQEGTFKVKKDGSLHVVKLKELNASLIVRLQPKRVGMAVSIIPECLYSYLKIDATPSWLKIYKGDTNSVERLYKWGYMYNGWNLCERALGYLTKAKSIKPNFKGLNVELAYSYNCLHEYAKAEQILEEEIKSNPTDAYVNKEYIYTISKSDVVDKAVTQYYKSIDTIEDKSYNAENCYNILQFYYLHKDKENFQKWFAEFNKYETTDKNMKIFVKRMSDAMSK